MPGCTIATHNSGEHSLSCPTHDSLSRTVQNTCPEASSVPQSTDEHSYSLENIISTYMSEDTCKVSYLQTIGNGVSVVFG